MDKINEYGRDVISHCNCTTFVQQSLNVPNILEEVELS